MTDVSADEPTVEEEVEESEAPRRRRFSGKKIFIFIVLPIVVIVVGYMGFQMMGGGEEADPLTEEEVAEAPPAESFYYDLPDLLVNLNTQGKQSRYLKLSVSLEIHEQETIEKLEKLLPRIIDRFQVYLRELRTEDISGSAGVYRLKEELLGRVNKSAATPAVSQQMHILFADLFVEGGADTLSPLTALSLYYEFGDLSQDGAAGGRIAEGLANRLVDVDLLDRASELLQRQLAFVGGVDNARIGARLAVIHLLDQKPARAIETLAQTRGEGADVPVALMQERRHLEARALAAVGDSEAALALLKTDDSREATVLRADIHWRFEQWPEAVTELAKLVEGGDGDIAANDQHLIMRQVVALMLSGDSSGLALSRERYGKGMAASVYRNAFELITASTDTDAVPIRELPRILANIENAEAFLQTYRDAPPDEANAVN
jgi:flagellar basal body-associated protein FliL